MLRRTLRRMTLPTAFQVACKHGLDDAHPFACVRCNAVEHARTIEASRSLPNGGHKVDYYLHNMPCVTEARDMVKDYTPAEPKPFENTVIFMIQHLTAEVMGCISMLRTLGCTDLVNMFVGYNPDAEAAYKPVLQDLSTSECRSYILKTNDGGSQAYTAHRDFSKSLISPDEYDAFPWDALDKAMATGGSLEGGQMDFIESMRCMCVYTFFQTVARARAAGKEVIILEDGGYTTPIFNVGASNGQSVAECRKLFRAPADTATDEKLGSDKLRDVMTNNKVIGSVEYTRNGYDHDIRAMNEINPKIPQLIYPNMAVACSYRKTQIEADGVSQSCLNAITNAMYSHGQVLRYRNALVIGSRGNIGRCVMRSLYDRLDRSAEHEHRTDKPLLIGCDLKVGRPASKTEIPEWQVRDSEPALTGDKAVKEVSKVEDFGDRLYDVDLVFGITGGPSKDPETGDMRETMDRVSLQKWIVNSKPTTLYFASGSTKTAEFPDVLSFINDAVDSAEVTFLGKTFEVSKVADGLHDAISGRNFGGLFRFVDKANSAFVKDIALLNNTMPINFLFYGVPTEIIDITLAQLMSITVHLHRQVKYGKLPATKRVFAIDYDPEASGKEVWGAVLKDGQRFPIPQPTES